MKIIDNSNSSLSDHQYQVPKNGGGHAERAQLAAMIDCVKKNCCVRYFLSPVRFLLFVD
jgi:hypothetical protein